VTIRRTEFEVSVKGADATAKAFDEVAQAEGRATGAAVKTSDAIDRAAESAARATAAVPRLGDAFERVTGPTGKALRVFNDVGDAFRLLTAGLAGGALFGGLQDIAEAMGLLADKAGLTAMRVDALVRSGGTLSTDLVQRKLEITNLSDAMERYAKSVGLASAAQLTFREQQAALQGIATGRIRTLEGEQKAAEKAQEAISRARAELARFEAAPERFTLEVTRAGGESEYRAALQRRIADAEAAATAADRAQRALLGREGANPWVEGVQEFGASLVTRTRLAVEQTAWGLRNQLGTYQAILAQRYQDAQRVSTTRAAGGRGAAADPATAEQMARSFGLPRMPGQMTDQDARDARAERERQARADAEHLERMHGLGLMMAGHAAPAPEAKAPSLLAVLTADDEERARFEADMETASAGVQRMYAATQEAADGARQLGQSMGLGLSNAAAAALLTGGSFKKLANDVLKSIAVQAAGLAIFETAKGFGNLALAAFGVPNAAAAASLNFQSAAMYGAVAAVAGAGAGATGGLRSGGSARAMSAGVAPSMGGTSQYGGGSGGATVVQVYISGEQVTRAVRVEQSRQRMSGGITGRAA
jgi:hypothetical protein